MSLHLDGSKLFWHLDRLADWQENREIAPVHVEISPTNACNYRCIFCYADYSGHKPRHISNNTYLQIMRDLGTVGVRSCLIAGDGEPLVHPATVKAIAVGHQAGVDMALNTNALLLSSAASESALPHLTWLRASVMAFSPDVYGFLHGTPADNLNTVLRNLERAAEIKRTHGYAVTIGLQQVLLPENGTEAPKLAAWARDAGLDYYVLKPFSLHGQNAHYKEGVSAIALRDTFREHLLEAESFTTKTFSSIIRWNTFADDGRKEYDRCLGLPFIMQIASDAKAYTCCPYFGDENFCYGDLNTQSLSEVWFGEFATLLRKKIADCFDPSSCMTYCRHHQINKQLWALRNPPQHVNFI